MIIEKICSNDLKYAHKLTQIEDWGTSYEELREIYNISNAEMFLAIVDSKKVGIVSVICYGSFGFIGNLIVEQGARQKGYGRKLITYSIDYLKDLGVNSILIDAVPEMVSLYEKFNFRTICQSLRFEGNTNGSLSDFVTNLGDQELRELINFDKKYFGGNRKELLVERYTRNPKYCKVLKRKGKVRGYIMGTQRENNLYVGPWVVEKNEPNPESLIQSLMEQTPQKVKLGVLESNKKAVNVLKGLNFKIYSFSIRMYLGKLRKSSRSIFSIAGPDRG